VYQKVTAGGYMRVEDGAYIPEAPGNRDYEAVLEWIAAGNEPLAPAEASIDAKRAAALARVNDIREVKIVLGVPYAGHVYDSDQRSRDNLSATVAAVAAGVPLPDGFSWRTADNVDVPMSPAELVGLAGTMLGYVNMCYARSWALKGELAAAEDPSTVDIESGWPQ
jgi:hypothetical protein